MHVTPMSVGDSGGIRNLEFHVKCLKLEVLL